MPTCPGCHETVSYDRLATHTQYCTDIDGEEGSSDRSMERLVRRVERIERRLEDRLSTIEDRLAEESPRTVGSQRR